MKPIRTILILSFGLVSIAAGQKYHVPAEIFKIAEQSKITYQISTLEIPEVEVVKYPPQLDHGLFLKKGSDGALTVSTYDEEYGANKDYQDSFKAAEKAYDEHQFAQARELYLKVLSLAPASSQVMTFIGQVYGHEGNDSLAEVWYRKAIEANYFDYMAHWFLADLCQGAGRKDEAVAEILVAHILNRNNPRLAESMERIFKGSGMTYREWQFLPRYEVKDLGNNKASVQWDANHPEWLAYALCKALWQIEPGYRDSMLNGTREHPLMVEEKECVVNVLIGIQNRKKETKDPALQVAQKALDEKMFSEFLVYEVILPRYPRFAFVLSKAYFDSVAKYVVKFRSQ